MKGSAAVARFYLDEDIPYDAAAVGVALGLDIVAAREVQPSLPQDDVVHLQSAASRGRILVTYNRDDFIVATRDAFAAGMPHAGVLILTRKLPRHPSRIAHELSRWLAAEQLPMQTYEIDFLSS